MRPQNRRDSTATSDTPTDGSARHHDRTSKSAISAVERKADERWASGDFCGMLDCVLELFNSGDGMPALRSAFRIFGRMCYLTSPPPIDPCATLAEWTVTLGRHPSTSAFARRLVQCNARRLLSHARCLAKESRWDTTSALGELVVTALSAQPRQSPPGSDVVLCEALELSRDARCELARRMAQGHHRAGAG